MALPSPATDSTCLVTGASSGIGAELARQLAGHGHGVTLVARREERLRDLADEISGAYGVRAEVLGFDVSGPDGRAGMIAAIDDLGLSVEVLINNAGFGSAGRFHELDPESEVALVRTNVEAVVALCGAYVPRMVTAGRGAVLNVGSTAAFQPLPGQATYGASKAFVLSFTEALSAELSSRGVTATVLCPGPVRTEFEEVAGVEGVSERTPSFLWMDAPEVAEAALDALAKGKRSVVPGRINHAGTIGGRHVPRSLLLPLVRRLNPFT
jgi:uncharacterized protein